VKKFLIPIALFALMGMLLWRGLSLDPKHIPSPLIDKPLPEFSLTKVHAPNETVSNKDLRGRAYLLNVWASWCVACRQEHPLLMEVSRLKLAPLIGLDYKDKREDALGFLGSMGNPYEFSLSDPKGRLGIDLGVYGVPETFVIDAEGVIRYKHIGPLTEQALREKILPLLHGKG
jgi:cytochrome c biogenesis protein CcmG/thiol:disulfide interchange protein DsbE